MFSEVELNIQIISFLFQKHITNFNYMLFLQSIKIKLLFAFILPSWNIFKTYHVNTPWYCSRCPYESPNSAQKMKRWILIIVDIVVLYCVMTQQFYFVFVSDSADRHWVGMWWGGFLICGACLLVIAIPFFFYPKELKVCLLFNKL